MQSFGSKIVFSITTSLIAIVFLNLFGELLEIKTPKTETRFADAFFIIILFATPYLWIFDILTGLGTFATSLFVITVFTFVNINNKKK